MMMKTIGLISSIPAEGTLLTEEILFHEEINTGGLLFVSGRLYNNRVVSVFSGIGKTNASHAATLLINTFSPALIINFGIGGAYCSSGLNEGDVAVAKEEIYADEGVITEAGFQGINAIGIPLLNKGGKKYFNKFVMDKYFVKKVMNFTRNYKAIAKWKSKNLRVESGTFLTVSACTGTIKRARELEEIYNPICENMEGAAIAHICAIYDIPMIEIRGISNIVEERDKSKWNIALAAENCQKMVLELLRTL